MPRLSDLPGSSAGRFGFALATLLLVAFAFGTSPLPAQQRRVEERIHANPDVMVRIHNMVGSVRVRAWDRDSLVVTGTVSETPVDRFEIHSAGAGAKLGIWDTSSEGLGPSHLEVIVPLRSTVWIKTASASIDVADVQGGLDLYSVSGGIVIAGAPREVYAESMGGSISISADTRSARIKTGSGPVVIDGTLVDVTATTVSGPIEIDGANVQRARFESVDGRILWRGAFMSRASLDFTSHAGPIEFSLPSDAAASFTINTFEGGLSDRWGLRIQEGGSKLKGRELRFSIGNGNATVMARTFKATVTIRRAAVQTLRRPPSSY